MIVIVRLPLCSREQAIYVCSDFDEDYLKAWFITFCYVVFNLIVPSLNKISQSLYEELQLECLHTCVWRSILSPCQRTEFVYHFSVRHDLQFPEKRSKHSSSETSLTAETNRICILQSHVHCEQFQAVVSMHIVGATTFCLCEHSAPAKCGESV